MPLIGSYCDQLMFEFGLLLDAFCVARATGNGWPWFCPVEAVMNGVANSGGAGLEYVIPKGAFPARIPTVSASIAVKYIPNPARMLVLPGPPRIVPRRLP